MNILNPRRELVIINEVDESLEGCKKLISDVVVAFGNIFEDEKEARNHLKAHGIFSSPAHGGILLAGAVGIVRNGKVIIKLAQGPTPPYQFLVPWRINTKLRLCIEKLLKAGVDEFEIERGQEWLVEWRVRSEQDPKGTEHAMSTKSQKRYSDILADRLLSAFRHQERSTTSTFSSSSRRTVQSTDSKSGRSKSRRQKRSSTTQTRSLTDFFQNKSGKH